MKGNYAKAADGLISHGENLVRLGKALKNPKTTISDLVTLADRCGFSLDIEIVPNEPQEGEE